MNVVVRTDDGAVSLLVDEIGDVLEVEDATFERPPETLRGVAARADPRRLQAARRLLLILDTGRASRSTASTSTRRLSGTPPNSGETAS